MDMTQKIEDIEPYEELILTTDGTVQHLLSKLLGSEVDVVPVVSRELIKDGILYRVVKFVNEDVTFGVATSIATGMDREFFFDVQHYNIGKAIDANKLMHLREIKQYYVTNSAIGRTYTLKLENGVEFIITEIFDRKFLYSKISGATHTNGCIIDENHMCPFLNGFSTTVLPID